MKIVYISNYFNHHQKAISDEFYKVNSGNYHFIATTKLPENRKKLGYPEYSEPYVINYWQCNSVEVQELIDSADVVIQAASQKFVSCRLNEGKIVFIYSERFFKSFKNYFKIPVYFQKVLSIRKSYLLCAGAYTAKDYCSLGYKTSRCYKWGYFPKTVKYKDIDRLIVDKTSYNREKVSILWAGRFISWKHPESVIYLAKMLKADGYKFEINMIGQGYLLSHITEKIKSFGLDDCVLVKGAMKNNDLRKLMEATHIFLFTSDSNEGWGAVLNESMNSACAVVASPNIGSVPYLIRDNENGLYFKNEDWRDLYNKVKFLIDNPDTMSKIQFEAYKTISETWNEQVAVSNFMKLCNNLLGKENKEILVGPCSMAR